MYIADLHIHSKYSRATSKELEPEPLDAWARRKGIGLVGTGDFTHPAWRAELQDKLAEAEEGLYTPEGSRAGRAPVRNHRGDQLHLQEKRQGAQGSLPDSPCPIWRRRKPSPAAWRPLATSTPTEGPSWAWTAGICWRSPWSPALTRCSSPLTSGRPTSPCSGPSPALTPSGECFGDLTGHIHALETGLSSDPTMICRCSALDGYTLVSNSDAHSPSKLGREANLLDTGLSYLELARAIQTGGGLSRYH